MQCCSKIFITYAMSNCFDVLFQTRQLRPRAYISCFEKQLLRYVGKTKRDFAKAVNIHDPAKT